MSIITDTLSVLDGQPVINSLIPPRNPQAQTGSQFIAANMNLSSIARDSNIDHELNLLNNIPDFLRTFVPITITEGSNTIILLVSSDGLCLGTNEDFLRLPLDPHQCQKLCNRFDASLPTRKIVNEIWKNAINKLEPEPLGSPYDETMSNTEHYQRINNIINKQLSDQNLDYTKLISGHKKDVVLTNQLAPNNPGHHVAIYGWIHPNSGKAIQDLNAFSHNDMYKDYSHLCRFIANDCIVNGNPMRLSDVFNHPVYSELISDEGPLKFQKY